MKKQTLKTIAVSAICLMVASMSTSAFAAGEKMLNSTAGKSYAGYGYTHGYVPVTVGTGGYYDNDIMKYDIRIEDDFNGTWGERSVKFTNNDASNTPIVLRISYNEIWSSNINNTLWN